LRTEGRGGGKVAARRDQRKGAAHGAAAPWDAGRVTQGEWGGERETRKGKGRGAFGVARGNGQVNGNAEAKKPPR